MPVEPSPTTWVLPDPLADGIPGEDVVGIGADLEPGTMLAGYRRGIFPMHLTLDDDSVDLGWWSPAQRGILPLDRLRVTRSLSRSLRRFRIGVDHAFADMVDLCRSGGRPGDRDGEWLTEEFRDAYLRLHALGWAHSVEAWDDEGLAGGLLCIEIGGLVCGESMATRRRDASKAALVGLVRRLAAGPGDPALPGGRLLDVQWSTDHLASLGAVEVPREHYLGDLLPRALGLAPVLRPEAPQRGSD